MSAGTPPSCDEGLRDAALGYAARGWRVLPLHWWTGERCSCRDRSACPSPAKHPLLRNGLHGASSDPAQVASWWQQWPAANVGLVTGERFDVLDIDDEAALDAIDAAAGADAEALDGPWSYTAKGLHLLVQPTGTGNRTRFLTGCDWRGRDGYIVAPPSVHATGHVYEWWRGPDTAPREAPRWLVEALGASSVATAKPMTPRAQPSPSGRYGARALDAELGRLAAAAEGTRNDQLNRSAHALGQLVGANELGLDTVVGALATVAERIGLSGREIHATIVSGLSAGIAQPRAVGGRR